jgi:hypothetical protein
MPNAVSVDLGPLKQTDYPMVKFWYRQDWAEFCVNNPGEATDPEAIRFVEDQHGVAAGKMSASMMHNLAQAIFLEHGTSGAPVPLTWERVDVEIKKEYYRAMAAAFFELRLCDSSWKADQIATRIYSSWFSGWQGQIMLRPLAIEGKRVRNWSMEAGTSKKFKAAAQVSTNTQPFRNLLINRLSQRVFFPVQTAFLNLLSEKPRGRGCGLTRRRQLQGNVISLNPKFLH